MPSAIVILCQMENLVSKKKILFTGEAHWLGTGFAVFNREIISRLHATGKYEIAEMGNWARSDEENARKSPWKFYGVLPNNKQEAQIYESNKINQFGVYKFDAVLADFQPDIVVAMTDPWMLAHLETSRFRKNYKTLLCPTVDSAPQKREWVEGIFKKADIITTYSRFGKRTLEQDGINVSAVTSPAVDLETFSPKEKSVARAEWDLPLSQNVIIIGTVMRNQKRKLYPDLFEAFVEMRARYGNEHGVKRAALLCHTSWPDLGWDLPELIRRNQIQRHVIFTYM